MNRLLLLSLATLLPACSLTPERELPTVAVPERFKEQPSLDVGPHLGEWKIAEPGNADDQPWWRVFGDARLDALEWAALDNNPSLQVVAARVEAARSTVKANASTLLPTIEIGGNAVRSKPSSAGVSAFGGNPNAQLKPYTLYSAMGAASYEVDLFGRVRDNERALAFDADAQEAMYRNVLLALQADVAQHYFSLRALDAERALLRDTVAVRTEAMRIMQKRFDLGEAGEQDVTRTRSELAGAEAELLALDRSRAVLEHALAGLLGRMPSDFALEDMPLDASPPQIPAGLPSSLLERRPDIAAAQAAMAAANARSGVARTAMFPKLVLTAFGGYESTSLGDIFNWSNRTWALGQMAGNALSMTVFDNGRNLARIDAADAAYKEAVANYRQQALAAFREVEDHLAGQRLLAEQSVLQDTAAQAARRTTDLVQTRYDEGDVNYFEVVDAQRNSLVAERAAVQIRGQRFMATVALVRALGGGWETRPAVYAPAQLALPATDLPPLTPAAE